MKAVLCRLTVLALSIWMIGSAPLAAQTAGGSLKGKVTDASGAVVPGATVTIKAEKGRPVVKQTDAVGTFAFDSLAAGAYNVTATAKGFAIYRSDAVKVDGATTFDIELAVALENQKVTVSDNNNTVSVAADSNASALVLRGADLEMLSDDPDELADDLQALAGPAAGPNGGQIFIDGFSGGRLPPKSSIREIRINQNPFSAEYDRLGFGRIEIFTKPGTDKFRGQAFAMVSDNVFNARNPFVATKPPFQSRMFGGNISGPLTKKSSFTFDVDHRGIDEVAAINATILDTDLNPVKFAKAVTTPQTRTSISPRFDYQLNSKNTLTVRYHYSATDNKNQGVSTYSLESRAYDMKDRDHSFQATETNIINLHTINETRFQHMRSNTIDTGDNSIPTISVMDAFTGGGAQIGRTQNKTNSWEIQNMTSHTRGTHAIKFGARVRGSNVSDASPQNYGGSFTFSGGQAPQLDSKYGIVRDAAGNPVQMEITSIERYRRTLLLQKLGYTAAQIRTLGGGPSQFTISGGNPLAEVGQQDVGLYLLDDWRVRPSFTLSYGMRYEVQTNISDKQDFSPRLSFAWGIGKGNQKKTVMRGGFGTFYDRVSQSLTLQALRANGINQQNYVVMNPDFFPTIPPLTTLSQNKTSQSIRQVDSTVRAPRIYQVAIGIERQLPRNTTFASNFVYSQGVHMLRTRNINAPYADGSYPFGAQGIIYSYESSGLMRQKQWIMNFNSRAIQRVSLFGYYTLNYSRGNTDGAGTQPANTYDMHNEWGPTSNDTRHRVFLGGSLTAPKRVSLSPFFTASSGTPFNITTGLDNNRDSIFMDRPAFATDPKAVGVVSTAWGVFKLNPGVNDIIIPRNYGRGPAHYSMNLRVSRTFGFGKKGETNAAGMGDMGGGPPGGPGGYSGRGGGGGSRGGGGGGPRGGGMMGGGGRGMMGGESSGKRVSITLSASARNLLNYVNLSSPNGNLSSPNFGQSLGIGAGFGPGGGGAASNRRIDFQMRVSF